MTPTIPDLMNALDDLEVLYRKVFQDFGPLYDEDDRIMRRALAVLHAHLREENQP